MGWMDSAMPPRNVITEDLELRGVNTEKWWNIAEEKHLMQKCINCYSRCYGRNRFDEHLHQCGVRLRMNAYCEWLLQEYPELRLITQDIVNSE